MKLSTSGGPTKQRSGLELRLVIAEGLRRVLHALEDALAGIEHRAVKIK